MSIIRTPLVGGILLAACLLAMGLTAQPDDTVAWQAGDGAKHYGGGHGR